jgi:hypothetical protein
MQNEPNLPKDQMNINKVLTTDYENKPNCTLGENEPKTNPNEPNFRKSQMNVNKVLTKDYENKPNWSLGENEPKTNPNEPNFPVFFDFYTIILPIPLVFGLKRGIVKKVLPKVKHSHTNAPG